MKSRKIILIDVEPILNYPPVLSILNILLNNYCEVVLCVSKFPESLKYIEKNKKISIIEYGTEFSDDEGILRKTIDLFKMRKFFWREIERIYKQDDLLWVCSAQTLKHLGKKVFKYKYVLHLFELIEELYYSNNLKIGKMGLASYCQKADKVVVCEYNRAFITLAWFGLSKLPIVLNNKPYNTIDFSRYAEITTDNYEIVDIMSKISDKKVVLYQGIIDEERPLDVFIEAVDSLGDGYAMVIMGKGSEKYKKLSFRNLYCLPFIEPPYHLEITSHAYIGILSYVPSYNNSLSKLNPIYCAPNKIFEYAQFGIPMLGNNIPGLKYTVEEYEMGLCIDSWDIESVKKNILEIDTQYDKYALNARRYYDNVDIEKIVLDIVRED